MWGESCEDNAEDTGGMIRERDEEGEDELLASQRLLKSLLEESGELDDVRTFKCAVGQHNNTHTQTHTVKTTRTKCIIHNM